MRANRPSQTAILIARSILLKWQQEPFKWAQARERLADLTTALGWQPAAFVDHDKLREHILAPAGLAHWLLARGEVLCHCTRSPHGS